MKLIDELGAKARAASRVLARLGTDRKNEVLLAAADALEENAPAILAANQTDLENAIANHMPLPLQDRLRLDEARIAGIAKGLREVAELPDPIGSVSEMTRRPNGLLIGKKRVPIGVIAVIYEARPNVTADVFALCFKSGNAMILKGGRDAYYSNEAIVRVLHSVLEAKGITPDAVNLLSDNSREASNALMRCNKYVDVLIPRGGAGLIRSCVENATVPVIETGTGNCHVYVDESADLQMAVDIIINGKTQRVGVCNAVESVLIHKNRVADVLPVLQKELAKHSVLIHAQAELLELIDEAKAMEAVEADWGTEYLDYEVSVKAVSDVDEAIDHINRYNTGHSEAIVTESYANAQKFLDYVDAAAVYVNASTRFTDGGQFGLGAEIGISTQKLHARGPMGLQELTSTKYIIYGNGQIRP